MAVDQNAETAPETDNFAAAFEMLSGLGDKEPAPNAVLTEPAPVEEPAKKEEPAAEKTPEQIEADAAATAAGEKTLDEQAAEAEAAAAAAEADPAAAAAAAAAPAKKEAPKPQPSANDDMLERLAQLVRDNPPEEKKPAAQQEAPALYTADEQEFLNTYEKDWPDVARAERLIRRGEYNALVTHVFAEIGKHFAPVQETVATLSQQTHLQALTSQVSDYEDVRDKVVDWVETQPDYLQVAYQHVITQGTTEQVVDLIQRWRQATGTPLPVAAAKKASDTELPAATKQAAAALAPVSSKRTAVIQTDDPNDYDGAFAKFSDIKV